MMTEANQQNPSFRITVVIKVIRTNLGFLDITVPHPSGELTVVGLSESVINYNGNNTWIRNDISPSLVSDSFSPAQEGDQKPSHPEVGDWVRNSAGTIIGIAVEGVDVDKNSLKDRLGQVMKSRFEAEIYPGMKEEFKVLYPLAYRVITDLGGYSPAKDVVVYNNDPLASYTSYVDQESKGPTMDMRFYPGTKDLESYRNRFRGTNRLPSLQRLTTLGLRLLGRRNQSRERELFYGIHTETGELAIGDNLYNQVRKPKYEELYLWLKALQSLNAHSYNGIVTPAYLNNQFYQIESNIQPDPQPFHNGDYSPTDIQALLVSELRLRHNNRYDDESQRHIVVEDPKLDNAGTMNPANNQLVFIPENNRFISKFIVSGSIPQDLSPGYIRKLVRG